ncbi:MAG: hypothetical protein ACK4VI_03855 [Alphaproteobacteria bacterium]
MSLKTVLKPKQAFEASATQRREVANANFAAELKNAASAQFPLHDIIAELGIDISDDNQNALHGLRRDEQGKLEQLNALYIVLGAKAFKGLKSCDAVRKPLSLDSESSRKSMKLNMMRVTAANEQDYFCGNLEAIRDALAEFPVAQDNNGEAEGYARALQKALVSRALKSSKPVIFMDTLIEDADKRMMSLADRYLRANDNAKDANKLANDANDLARR